MAFQLASAYVELSARGVCSFTGQIQGIGARLSSMTSLAGAAAAAIGGIVGVAGFTGLLKLAADAETVATQLETLTGSAEKAKILVDELKAFGASTPFEFPGLAETAKQLLAFQVAQDQIIPTMRILGDISAATGAPLNELAQIYGKVKSQGKLTAETLDQLGERSVPVIKYLAETMGVAESSIRGMVSAGQVGFGDLQRALEASTAAGGAFAGGMERQSKTLAGLWSTFTDEITGLLTDIGAAIVEGLDLKSALAEFTTFAGFVRGEMIPVIRSVIAGIKDFTVNNWSLIESILTLGVGFDTLWNIVRNGDLYWTLAQEHAALFVSNTTERILAFGQNVVEVFNWVGENWFNIVTTSASLVSNVFTNLTSNMVNAWDAFLEYLSTGTFEMDWTPLTQGFQNTLTKLNLTQPLIRETSEAIEAAMAELDRRMQPRGETNADRAAKGEAFRTDQGGAAGAAAKDGANKNKFEFIGFAQFADKMQQEAANASERAKEQQVQQQQLAAAQQQAAGIDKIAQMAAGVGLRIATGGARIDPAFG